MPGIVRGVCPMIIVQTKLGPGVYLVDFCVVVLDKSVLNDQLCTVLAHQSKLSLLTHPVVHSQYQDKHHVTMGTWFPNPCQWSAYSKYTTAVDRLRLYNKWQCIVRTKENQY